MTNQQNSIRDRDRVWRNIITTIPIVDNMNEFLILKFLIIHQSEIDPIKDYPFIFGWEFPFDPILSNLGKVDLILTDGQSKYLIVEVKHITETAGKNACAKRNKSRSKVRAQAKEYGKRFQNQHPDFEVRAKVFTNEIISHPDFEAFLTEEWEKIETIFQLSVPDNYSKE